MASSSSSGSKRGPLRRGEALQELTAAFKGVRRLRMARIGVAHLFKRKRCFGNLAGVFFELGAQKQRLGSSLMRGLGLQDAR